MSDRPSGVLEFRASIRRDLSLCLTVSGHGGIEEADLMMIERFLDNARDAIANCAPAPMERPGWEFERCKECGRPNTIGFSVSNGDWHAVMGDIEAVVCLTCFDARAELAGVEYKVLDLYPVTWADEAPGEPSDNPATPTDSPNESGGTP